MEGPTDTSGVRVGIERYRELAKYLITIFAAVGGLLLAGTQLTTIGSLSWKANQERILVGGIGLLVGVVAAVVVIQKALTVMEPFEMSLDDAIEEVQKNKTKLRSHHVSPFRSIDELAAAIKLAEAGSPLEVALRSEASPLLDLVAFRKASGQFRATRGWMIAGALVGIAGIVAFVWGVNPPHEETEPAPDPIVRPAPQQVTLTLTHPGKEVLAGSLGARCVEHRISAISVGGTEDRPRVVTLARNGCRLAQFSLPPNWGKATGTESAPAPPPPR